MSTIAPRIQRHFVTVGARQVHYRRAGSGPPVVLLHQTPQSSITMEPLLRRLADRFTAIALDTPGYGLSDRLPREDFTIADLADALVETLDALGIEQAAFAGQHTGATIIAELLVRHPQRATCAALDGYTLFDSEDRRTVLPHYTTPFEPAWDGSHLAWAWARFRDGWMFFPWQVRTQATRRDLDMPAPAVIQSYQLMELLRSGDAYRSTYRAVFDFDGVAAVRAFKAPVGIFCRAEDQLYPHLDRLPALPPNVYVERLTANDREGTWDRQAALVARHPPATVAQSVPRVTLVPAGITRDFLRAREHTVQLLVRMSGCDGPAIVLLHGAGESSAQLEALIRALSPTRRVIAIDLPGHGDSDTIDEIRNPLALAQVIADALTNHAERTVDVFGRGLGAAVAIELGLTAPHLVRRIGAAELLLLHGIERDELLDQYAPPIVPRWDGTHLLSLWHQLRDRQFFWPWYRRTSAAARRIEPLVDAQAIHTQLFDALRCVDYAAAHRAWFGWPVPRIAGLQMPFCYLAQSADCWARDADAMVGLSKHGARASIDGSTASLASALLRFFAD